MTDLAWMLLSLGVLVVALVLAVYLNRNKLLPLVNTRQRRVSVAIVAIFSQIGSGVLLSSIDFGYASTMGMFQTGDVGLVWSFVIVTSVMAAVEIFIVLHADEAEAGRALLIHQRNEFRGFRDFMILVSNHFTRVVSRKRERLKEITDSTQMPTALDPKKQIAALVNASWEIFNHQLKQYTGRDYRLRVAYYRCTHEGLELAHCFNGTASDCVRAPDAETSQLFRFDHPDGCLATAAAKTGLMFRVPDTTAAHRSRTHPFVFFLDDEKKTLRSIAALPIMVEGDSRPHPVLVIDTDVEGFFNEADELQETQLRMVQGNLAHRLLLEEKVAQLLGVK